MYSAGAAPGGFEVLYLSRTALPGVGEARIRFRYGKIDSTVVGIASNSPFLLGSGAWSTTADTAGAPDLTGFEIRIQVAPKPADPATTPTWVTCWWGQCEYLEDKDLPGAKIPMGERIFHCVDGFYRTKRWLMDRHGVYIQSSAFGITDALGHPGYNYSDGLGIVRGNKDNSGSPYIHNGSGATVALGAVTRHTWQGISSTGTAIWTDKEQVEHALRATRPTGEPIFSLSGSTTIYEQVGALAGFAREVNPSDSVWDFVNNVCRRQRGRGLVYVDWTESTAEGPLTVFLSVKPQTLADVTFETWPNGAATASLFTINGATTDLTTVTVDLIGDHRNVAEAFRIGEREFQRYEYVESRGEKIQVLATLSYFDPLPSLAKRWATLMETNFAALAPLARCDEMWFPVWQSHGLPHDWPCAIDGHGKTGLARQRIDYRCDDSGKVTVMSMETAPDTSPLLVRVLPDLPMLEGYNYTAYPPVRLDADPESGTPPRRAPFTLIRVSDNHYLFGEQITRPVTIHIAPDAIMVHAPADMDDTGAHRVISKKATATLNALYNIADLGVTVGIELPHQVRMADTALDENGSPLPPEAIKRRLVIEHNNIHLWIAPSNSIWDLDTTSRDAFGGGLARRSALGGTTNNPGYLRDDRAALAQMQALAASWYLAPRKTASWALKACGLLPTFEYGDGNGDVAGTIAYPRLGQLVTTMTAGGQSLTLNTPITSVIYNHEECVTTWTTDWCDLDFRS